MTTKFNLAAHVLSQADYLADKIALDVLESNEAPLTFSDLKTAVLGTATGLRDLGLLPGDRVLLRLGNTPDFPIAYLGALAAGFVPAPTSAALTEPEVSNIIKELNPAVILRASNVACPQDKRIVQSDALQSMRTCTPSDWHMGDPDRPGYIIYTSGTSGVARAVVHAHRAILARQMMFDGWYGLRQQDRVLHAGAFNWTYTLGTGLMDPWTIGATALIPAPDTPAPDLLHLVAEHKATIFAAAPGVYRQALRGPCPALPDLRHGLSAGEKLPDVTRQSWQDATQTQIYEAFGMSEISTFISSNPTEPAVPGTLGRPQPGRRMTLIHDTKRPETNMTGVIAVHKSDPGLFLEYLDQPKETARRFDGEWFLTGDLGQADEFGNITYLGRSDDMMNAGGIRVSPIEVERVLNDFDGITGSIVVELPIKSAASIIAAFYTSASPVDEHALNDYLHINLARYKCPRQLTRIETLPTGANGKLLRRHLRDTWKGPN
ncbi:MAG: class I adenylate-forming enzyme family protein [Paracoccaceae bacterium]